MSEGIGLICLITVSRSKNQLLRQSVHVSARLLEPAGLSHSLTLHYFISVSAPA
jgi:hypothetical protein